MIPQNQPGLTGGNFPGSFIRDTEVCLMLLILEGRYTLPDLSRYGGCEESGITVMLQQLMHRWLAEQNGEHYRLTCSGRILAEKLNTLIQTMHRKGCIPDSTLPPDGEKISGNGHDGTPSSRLFLAHREAAMKVISGTNSCRHEVDNERSDLIRTAGTFEKFIDFFESHSLEGVPEFALQSVGSLVEAELVCDVPLNFAQSMDKYLQIIEEAEWIHGVSAFATPYIADAIGRKVLEGAKVELVVTPELALDLFNEPYLESAKQQWQYRNLKFRVSRIPVRVGLTVTDKAISFGLFTHNGNTYDSIYDLISRSRESLEWGERLFSYYREHSEPLTRYFLKSTFSSILKHVTAE